MENQEVWKDIKGFEDVYLISNLGRVKSFKGIKERILKGGLSRGYPIVVLDNKSFRIHQLLAVSFLNHKPYGHKIVVDHINNVKTDNRLENIQLITNRENSSKDRNNKTSIHTGVSWSKKCNK